MLLSDADSLALLERHGVAPGQAGDPIAHAACAVDSAAATNAMLLAAGQFDARGALAEDPCPVALLRPSAWRGPLGFELTQLVVDAGLRVHQGRLLPVLRALHRVLVERHALLVEAGPLLLDADGAVTAGAARVELDDNGPGVEPPASGDALAAEAERRKLRYLPVAGRVGVVANGAALGMNTIDLVREAGPGAAGLFDIGGMTRPDVIASVLELLAGSPAVEGILVNLFAGTTDAAATAAALVESARGLRVPLVVRLSGNNREAAVAALRDAGVETFDETWDAAHRIALLLESRL